MALAHDSGGHRVERSQLPDPSSFSIPDSYSFHSTHAGRLPALSSGDSSSASTRSSAYTSSGSTLPSDYGHVHVASLEDETSGAGITPASVGQLLANDPMSHTTHSRIPSDHPRWSESYDSSVRSRSSSFGTSSIASAYDQTRLQRKPSYDMGWQPVDERDEVGMSEEETDEDHGLLDDDEYEDDDQEEERTAAVVFAEEGRGLIVQGDGGPLTQLQIPTGTTHLLIGSSSTPNAMPSFLSSSIPHIYDSLLALDISANFLGALPPILTLCTSLEELNIASNPLRVLPVFLADLANLRVLIADSTGITTLPDTLADLDRLHTLSIRRNKMNALPSWLCLLPTLQTLYVDGNPFQGPWKALVEPLLARVPMTPLYPPSTPMFPLPSAASAETEQYLTDGDDISDPPSSSFNGNFAVSPEDEDHTITPDKAPFMNQPAASPSPSVSSTMSRPLVRTRTTPNRAYSRNNSPLTESSVARQSSNVNNDAGYFADHELRKMKSAGDLRRAKAALAHSPESAESTSAKPSLSHYATSLSSSNLLHNAPERPAAKRFASVGAAGLLGDPSTSVRQGIRPSLTQSMWNTPEDADDIASNHPHSNRTDPDVFPRRLSPAVNLGDGMATVRPRSSTKDSKEKGSRWGFLKKMSMGKMKIDTPPKPPLAHPNSGYSPKSRSTARSISSNVSPGSDRFSKSPQINMRISTTGTLDTLTMPLVISPPSIVESELSPPRELRKQASTKMDALKIPQPTSPNLLAPPSPTPRSAKRRSFLPIEGHSLNIPDPSTFNPGVTATNEDECEDHRRTPSPIDHEALLLREEERMREGYMRALRSVMAYLKDMHDLGRSQQPQVGNTMTMYGMSDEATTRPRRPTVGEREASMISASSTAVSSLDSSGQLRSSESMAGLRSGPSAQTLSVATTDSSGSSNGEERKFKDDKGKRAMVVKEIVITERKYVSGLQELVDIYIKPGCAPANVLGSSSKDTVVPAAERKIVFNGVDALFAFHKDSFLPALEVAAAALMKTAHGQDVDPDGQLSLNVAKAVGNIFLQHAAFMRMYSSYINNFDNALQRIKHWTTERSAAGNSSPASAISPSSSTAQLVGLGLSLSSISSPGVVPDTGIAANGMPNISTSQRKRIRSYLKRCRLSPRHSQLNLDGYLLLPVQRIPRYRLLLEELLRSTYPTPDYMDDPLERALAEISLLANNMNEGKREAESRRKLVQWQARIRGKFPSPLVQPHRRLIMDGPLLLTRVVRKAMVSFEAINAQGDTSIVQVDCLAPELTPRPLIGILCNDLLVLCRDPSEGKEPSSYVDLWAVLRMQTLPQPASIVHGNALRLVDNKAILYFDAPSPSDALNWYRAINLHIPASKT